MKQKVPYVLESFSYQHVALLNSHWERQRQDTIELYLSIKDDDLLLPFRQKSGMGSDAHGLLGWYGHGLLGWYGHGTSTFGQILGALAKLWLCTGDHRLFDKAEYLANEWGRCAGHCPEPYQNGTYVFDKLIGGFLDMVFFMGYEKGLDYISKLTDQAISTFRTDIGRDGLQDHRMHGQIEWYTLPEQLYRAHQITGDEKYLKFAQEWDYIYYWNKLGNHDFAIGPRHAYSHVNALSSAAQAFVLSGDEKYMDSLRIAYDELWANHTYATGGYGPAECLYSDVEGYLGNSLMDTWDQGCQIEYTNFAGSTVSRSDVWGSCEVSCCAWAVFKFCNYMLLLTGEAKYGHWVENMLYNCLGGQLPITPTGKVMYYADYFINGGLKSVEDRRLDGHGDVHTWQCCTGTFPQDVAEYANALYYKASDGLYVSQYLASEVRFEIDGSDVVFQNYSQYPEEKQIRFRIQTDSDVFFLIRFRVPFWAQGSNRFSVNGQAAEQAVDEKGWIVLADTWKNGDNILIDFEYRLEFQAVDTVNPDIVALRYGPFVLATDEMTLLRGDVNSPETWIVPVDERAFIFKTKPGHVGSYEQLTRTFKPYYLIPEMEWYYMYNRIVPLGKET